MWLTSSSIGRKFVMALTGICLVLFVTFHVLMNAVAIIWPAAYNVICMLLGANWYALIASFGLGVIFIFHIIYAVWLTIQNRAARGNDRYAVNAHYPGVEWSSKNMLVLGIVILAFLVVHLIQFWARMQWVEIKDMFGNVHDPYTTVAGVAYTPEFGTLFLQAAFSLVWTPIVYIIGFVALWFHMNHGFWSMFHTIGWDNNIWIKRLKCIGLWWTSIVVGLFIAQAIVFTVLAHRNHYLNDPELQQQYATVYNEKAEFLIQHLTGEMKQMESQGQNPYMIQEQVLQNNADEIFAIVEGYNALSPNSAAQYVDILQRFYPQLKAWREAQAQQAVEPVEEEVVEEEVEVIEPEVIEEGVVEEAPNN